MIGVTNTMQAISSVAHCEGHGLSIPCPHADLGRKCMAHGLQGCTVDWHQAAMHAHAAVHGRAASPKSTLFIIWIAFAASAGVSNSTMPQPADRPSSSRVTLA